jgi:predicted DNA binding CopG/RHH family protein
MASNKSIKATLEQMKKAKSNESGAVIYVRISAKLRDAVHNQLQKDGLTYKDLLTAVICDYLGLDALKET